MRVRRTADSRRSQATRLPLQFLRLTQPPLRRARSCIVASSAKVALGYGALEAAYDVQTIIVMEKGRAREKIGSERRLGSRLNIQRLAASYWLGVISEVIGKMARTFIASGREVRKAEVKFRS
jgi:hypothetical protein